jgi:hypothetical protein
LQKCAPCRYLPTLQFWSKYDYPSRSSCPFFHQIKKNINTFRLIFHNLNLTSISYSSWNITWNVLKFIKKNWSKGRTAKHIFGREPSNDYFIKILFLLSKWFQTKRFLWEFPIGSYVKLSSAVAPSWSVFWNAGHNAF